MKRLLFFLITCLSVSGFLTGCNTDSTKYYDGIGTVSKTDNSSATYTITLDDGTLLSPTAVDSYGPNLKNDQRVVVRYSIVSTSTGTSSYQYNIKVKAISAIPTSSIFNITAATQDSIGNDPITVYYMWITGKYLNFELQYNGAYTTHMFNLVKDAQKQQDASGYTINLELRHNSKGDPGQQQLYTIVCFDLSSLQSTKSPVNLVITNKDLTGQTVTNQISYNNSGISAINKQSNKINVQKALEGILK